MNRHSETSATAQKELTAKRSGIASIRDVQESGDVLVDPRAIEPHTRAACGTRG